MNPVDCSAGELFCPQPDIVSRAIRILRARIGARAKERGRGKNTYGVKGQVFVRKRNAIILICYIIPRECHMKLHNLGWQPGANSSGCREIVVSI